ncbi:MAG TPA: tetratricopeptide repeat protein [Planctomycetes bacterium]|nr:tetratricopeptide repeat protein [Planctomycetota bacterium]
MKKALVGLAAVLAITGCTVSKGPSKITAQLLRDLKSPDEEERCRAAVALGFKQTEKRWAMPELAKYVEDKNALFALRCHEALQRLTGDETVKQERRAWQEYVDKLIKSWDKEGKPPTEVIQEEKARLFNEEGYIFMMQGDYLSAEQKFLDAIGLCPDNATYHNNLAKNYLNMRRYEEAQRFAMRAISLNPDMSVAYMNEGDAYAALDKPYEATNAYLEALKRDKNTRDWAVRWKLAKLHLTRNMLNEAQQYIDEAVKINPREPNLRVSAALIRYGREEYFKSWQEVQKVRELGYDWEDGAFLKKLTIELKKMGMEFPEEEDKQGKPLPAFDTGGLAPSYFTPPRAGDEKRDGR